MKGCPSPDWGTMKIVDCGIKAAPVLLPRQGGGMSHEFMRVRRAAICHPVGKGSTLSKAGEAGPACRSLAITYRHDLRGASA